jgi:hypothetical protein
MDKDVFTEIESVINTISILQSRESALREDLEFFKQKWKDAAEEACKMLYIGAFKRLEHESMFLCIEVYSLHQGIEKQRSLYSKVIKQNGKLLSKVDKSPGDEGTYMFLGVIGSHGKRNFTTEEKNNLIDEVEKEAYKSRKKLRDNFGITSHKHNEIDEWLNQILDNDVLAKIAQYRKEFAHRLDSLDNLKSELDIGSPDGVEQILDVVSIVLNTYNCCLQNILVYTRSELFLGVENFKYDSLSRLKLAESLIESDQF